jgi:hypothetical protein
MLIWIIRTLLTLGGLFLLLVGLANANMPSGLGPVGLPLLLGLVCLGLAVASFFMKVPGIGWQRRMRNQGQKDCFPVLVNFTLLQRTYLVIRRACPFPASLNFTPAPTREASRALGGVNFVNFR